MASDVAQLLKDKGWSDAEAGRHLHRLLGSPDAPNAATLGTYIGQIKRKKPEIWHRPNMRAAREQLAALFECEVLDLFPELVQPESASAFRVPWWPSLRAYDPSEKLPPPDVGVVEPVREWNAADWQWPVATVLDFVLRRAGRQAFEQVSHGPQWLVMPRGAGRRFLAAYLEYHGFAVFSLQCLRDVGQIRKPGQGPVLCLLEDKDERTDAEFAAEVAQIPSVTVIAPFPPPPSQRVIETREIDFPTEAAESSRWLLAYWRGTVDSRRELVAWAERRVIGESLLSGDGDATADWLDVLDPDAKFLATPEAILTVCSRVGRLGLPKTKRIGLQGLLGTYLSQVAAALDSMARSTADWLSRAGEDSIRQMLLRRMDQVELLGWDLAPLDVWLDFVPDAGFDAADFAVELDRMAGAKTLEARHQMATDLKRAIAVAGPRSVIEHLRRARLLVPTGSDQWRLEPSWFAETLVRERLRRLVRGPAREWGAFAFDPRRREALDYAADELVRDAPALVAAIHALSEAPAGPDSAGAVETLFAAVGRALIAGVDEQLTRFIPDLHLLWKLQMAVAVERFLNHVPIPCTGTSSVFDQTRTWFLMCWGWSFALPPPPHAIALSAAWLFPGWTSPDLRTLPTELRIWAEREPQRWAQFVELCSRNLDQTPPTDGIDLDEWAAWAWAQLDAGREIDPAHRPRIKWRVVAALLLLPVSHDDPRRAALAERVLHYASNVPGSRNTVWTLNAQPNELERLLNECATSEVLTATLDVSEISPEDVVLRVTRRLPERLRLDAVLWALRRKQDLAAHLHCVLGEVSHLPDEGLGALATAPRANAMLVDLWYRRAPQAAFDWLVGGHLADPSADRILASLSERHLTALLATITPTDLPDAPLWAASWVGRHPALVHKLWPWLSHPAVVPES